MSCVLFLVSMSHHVTINASISNTATALRHFASEICESRCGSRRRRRRRRRGSFGGARSRGPGRSRGRRGCRGCRGPTSLGRGTLGRNFDSLKESRDLKTNRQKKDTELLQYFVAKELMEHTHIYIYDNLCSLCFLCSCVHSASSIHKRKQQINSETYQTKQPDTTCDSVYTHFLGDEVRE